MSPDRRDGQSRTPKYLKETKKIKKPIIEDAVNFVAKKVELTEMI